MTRSPPWSSSSQVSDSAPHRRLVELVTDGPHEMRGDPLRGGLAGEDHFLALGRGEVGRRVLIARHRGPAVGQQAEDQVAALHDRRVGRDHQVGLRAILVLGDDRGAALDGVAHQVVVRRRLGQPGDDRGLRRVDVLERDPEVRVDRRLHAVALVAVVVLVEVGGDDLLLAGLAREGLGHPDRLDDLLELALGRPVRVLDELLVEQSGADQLLGDGRRAAGVAAQRAERRRDDGDRVEAGVLPEGLVLDRGRRVEQDLGDLVELDDLAPGITEAGQLDRAGAVVDDRLLGEDVVGQDLRVVQAVRQRGVQADGSDRRDRPEPGEEPEDDDREPAHGGRLGAARGALARGGSGGGHGPGRTP